MEYFSHKVQIIVKNKTMSPHEGLNQLLHYFTYLQQTSPFKLELAKLHTHTLCCPWKRSGCLQ
jgi:hypothetical protein